MKINELRLIPRNTEFWSLSLQMNIRTDEDVIVEITNTIHGDNNYFFGKMKLLLFEHLIPGLADRANGDIGISFDKTMVYTVPKPTFI